jgi:hypothetical protein
MHWSLLPFLLSLFPLSGLAGKFHKSRSGHARHIQTRQNQNSSGPTVYTLQDLYQGESFLKYVVRLLLPWMPLNRLQWLGFFLRWRSHPWKCQLPNQGKCSTEKTCCRSSWRYDRFSPRWLLRGSARWQSWFVSYETFVLHQHAKSDNTLYSIRIVSKKTYDNGLFIADFRSMPHGCGTWPAYWSSGPNWPNQGTQFTLSFFILSDNPCQGRLTSSKVFTINLRTNIPSTRLQIAPCLKRPTRRF